MYKKLTITTIISLLLCISVSFAWMLDIVGPTGKNIIFDLTDSLYVASEELNINISYEEDGVYKEVFKYENNVRNSENPLKFENQEPGSTQKFSIDIKNLSNVAVNISIVFSNIFADHEAFYDYIDIGLISINGYDSYLDVPKIEELTLRDRLLNYDAKTFVFSSTKPVSASLLNDVLIPANSEGINIKFYIRFNFNAINELQKLNFSIGKINFISV